MHKLLKSFLVLFALLVVPVSAQANENGPSLLAVSFHADWCGSCEVLGGKIKEAKSKSDLEAGNVLFIKFDLTDDVTKNQSALLASLLGLSEIYEVNKKKTGYIILIDPKTSKEISRVTKSMSVDEIIQTFTAQ